MAIPMSLKAELETWRSALEYYDREDYDKALELFEKVGEGSKIFFNLGIIYATLGEHARAVEYFRDATTADQFLAVAYHQSGVSNFLLEDYVAALQNFDDALLYLRGNESINYNQIGLSFVLYSCEVHFNRGLCLLYLNRRNEGMAGLMNAQSQKQTAEHDVIDEAAEQAGDGYTVFSIPVGKLYRPPDAKLRNLAAKDYLGKAKLVAASDERDAFTTFTGVTRLKMNQTPSGAPLTGIGSRSNSDPGPRPFGNSVNLERAKTQVRVPPKEINPALMRSATTAPSANKALPNGFPVRSTSVRAPPSAPKPLTTFKPQRSKSPTMENETDTSDNEGPGNRTKNLAQNIQEKVIRRPYTATTSIYDYYSNDEPPPPPLHPVPVPQPKVSSVERWAQNAKDASPPLPTPLSRKTSASGASSAPPVSFGGTAPLRRKLTTTSLSRSTSRAGSARGGGALSGGGMVIRYDGEDEGYATASEEADEFEMTKVRLKVHYQGDIRGMSLTPELTFDEFRSKVRAKYGSLGRAFSLQFKDEDDTMISMLDEDDYESAIDTARAFAAGRPEGKLEIWVNGGD